MLRITKMDAPQRVDVFGPIIRYVHFSDGKTYETELLNFGERGWHCSLRTMPSQRRISSQKRRRMVLDYLQLGDMTDAGKRMEVEA